MKIMIELQLPLNSEQSYYIDIPDLPGCHTEGDSIPDALRNLADAVELCTETLLLDFIKESQAFQKED